MRQLMWVGLGIAVATAVQAKAPLGTVVSDSERPWKVAASGLAKAQPLLEGDNAFVGRLSLAPGAAVPEHTDATEEYVVVLSGGGTMVLDGVTYELTAGHAVLMPAGVKASYVNGPAPTEILQVFAGPEPAAKYDAWAVAE